MTEKKTNKTNIDRFPSYIIYLGIFLIALLSRLWFAFFDGHSIIYNACDASEYVVNAKRLQDFFQKPIEFWIQSLQYLAGLLTPEAMSSVRTEYQALHEISNRSGPVYPLFLFFSFWLFQVEANSQNLFAPVFVQCCFSALTCILILYSGTKLWNLKTGFIAATLSAFYPGFIINASRLVSESLAAFWFMLAVCLAVDMLVERKGNYKAGILLGISLGIMQLIRSAMLMVSLVFLGAGLFSIKLPKAKQTLVVVILSICIPLGSFACFQYLVNGTPSIVVDRLGGYNLFTGLDLDAKGWLVYPYPNYGLIENKSLPEIIVQKFEHSPKRFFELLINKPPRLFAFHWNDFKTPIGYFSQSSQIIYHQLCFLLAAIGLAIGLWKSSSKESSKSIIGARFLVLFSFLAHFAYCAFITLPRYGLSAMPCVLLFSGAGLTFLINKFKDDENKKLALLLGGSIILLLVSIRLDLIGLITLLSPLKQPFIGLGVEVAIKIASILLFTNALYKFSSKLDNHKRLSQVFTGGVGAILCILAALPLKVYGSRFEWKHTLSDKDDFLSTVIKIPSSDRNERSGFFLIVDSPNWQTLGQSTAIFVNGKKIDQPVIPLMALSQYNRPGKQVNGNSLSYDLESITSSIILALGGTNLDLRQWFLVPIPEATITDTISNRSGQLEVKLQNSSTDSLTYYGNYTLKKNQVVMPGISRYSFEKAFYGIENNKGLSDIRYEDKIAIDTSNNQEIDLSSEPGLQTGTYNVRLLELRGEPNLSFNEGEDSILELEQKEDGLIETKKNNFALENFEGVILLTLEANIESRLKDTIKTPLSISILVEDEQSELSYKSPWVPSHLVLSPGANTVKLTVPMNLNDWKEDGLSVKLKINRYLDASKNQFFSIKKTGLKEQEFNSTIKNKTNWHSIKARVSYIQNFKTLSQYKIF